MNKFDYVLILKPIVDFILGATSLFYFLSFPLQCYRWERPKGDSSVFSSLGVMQWLGHQTRELAEWKERFDILTRGYPFWVFPGYILNGISYVLPDFAYSSINHTWQEKLNNGDHMLHVHILKLVTEN